VGVSFRGWVGVAVSGWQTCPIQRSAQHNTTYAQSRQKWNALKQEKKF